MMGKLRESLAGPGYVILNVIRAINIIVFLDMIAACVVMLVKTETTNGFFFFEAVTHVVVALVSIFLIISELPILRGYFNRQWPLFGEEAGFMALAAIMMILGIATLGNLNFAANSQKNLGLAFWRVVISAGVLAMVMSLVNILTTIVFTNHQSGVSARHVRAYGAVAPRKVLSRASSRRSFQLSIKREDSLPTYSREPAFKRYSRQLANRIPIKISSPFSNPNNVTNASDVTETTKDDCASSKYSRSSGGDPRA
ncbi:uncharacterized protein N7483_012151 [Penicillium malachiteum]|uniref:uncharacterized protein n=1 Tax=Penicillium malachiteum TaxID=1324776 RepID=UPI0025499F55|nr:uncharacterized protein N7483_012151 [Penicillium malachiteum]KAJ5714970.1 hypothetical protein N7483_012151 [Penicillium malachiteum]